jgi:hypothetical protein
MAQGGHSLLSAAVVIVGFNTREPVLLVLAFDRGPVGMSRNFARGRRAQQPRFICPVSAWRLLQFVGGALLYDMDRDCRGALQIGKLPLLAMNLSMSGTAAWSPSSLQPLG